MGFSVFDVMGPESKAGIKDVPQARFRTKDISVYKMYRNEKNFYSIEAVEELAGEILMYGLKQNLELVYEPCEKGEYRIIAGERRWMALKLLVEKGYKEFEIATCKLTSPQGEEEEQIEIIIANAYRDKSIADMIEEEKRLKEALEKMKAEGKKIKGYDLASGRLRDVIAGILKMSCTKVAQIESVNRNLIPEFREELKKERLTFSAAYEISGMPEEEQKEALEKYRESGVLSYKEVKEIKDREKDTESSKNDRRDDDAERQQYTEYQEPCRKNTVINGAEPEKTEEQKYSEEQDRIDRETAKRLREMEDEKKMECLPGKAAGAAVQDGSTKKYIRIPSETFSRIISGNQKYLILKNDKYREGQEITAGEFKKGRATGKTLEITILHMDDEETSSALEAGYCVIGIRAEPGADTAV